MREKFVTVWIYILAFLFAFSAFSKLWDLGAFQASLATLAIPAGLQAFSLHAVPIGELALSGWLLFNRKAGLMCGLLTLALFTIVVTYSIQQGGIVSCGCFGAYSEVDVFFFIRNGVLAVLTYMALSFEVNHQKK